VRRHDLRRVFGEGVVRRRQLRERFQRDAALGARRRFSRGEKLPAKRTREKLSAQRREDSSHPAQGEINQFSITIAWSIVRRAVALTSLDLAERLGLAGPCAHFDEALTHPSFANEQRESKRDNQRLEFLGDAVLGLCVSEMLMGRFPEAREGELSLMRASLVNTDALAAWAREAALGEALRLGRGADAAGERTQKNVLADAVEAIVGAVYLDLGLDAARGVARAIIEEPLEKLASGPPLGRDPKSELQERVQARGGTSPKYRVVEAIGPDHNREFIVAVEVDGETLGEGRGRSKKQAEQEAAREAMRAGHPFTIAVMRGDLPLPRYTVETAAAEAALEESSSAGAEEST
jgi:ribonuclease-3